MYIGIDLGGTNIAVGLVGKDMKLVRKASTPTKLPRPAGEIMADMAALCKKVAGEEGLTLRDVEYIGVASPGIANKATGILEYANNLQFYNVPMVAEMERLTGCKVHIDNDANAAALGEAVAGAAKGCEYVVMITLGTGLGGGIIINKKVYSGFNFAGAELGHIVIEYNGRPCTCGRKGCWESYSSATGLIAMTREAMEADPKSEMWAVAPSLDRVDGRTAFAAARRGDKSGMAVVDLYIEYLACGIASCINVFQPEKFIIGGGVCNEGDFLLKPLLAKVDREQYSRDSAKKTQILVATLGNDAGIIGAAALGL